MVAGAWSAAMVAAADGGVRGENGREREGEGKEDVEQRKLTLEVMVRTARSGEAGVDGEVLDGAAARAEETGTVASIVGSPVRFIRRGSIRRRGGAAGVLGPAPGGSNRRRCGGGRI